VKFSILCSTVSPLPFDIQGWRRDPFGSFSIGTWQLTQARHFLAYLGSNIELVLSNLGGIEKRMNGAASYDSKYDYGHSTSFLNIPSEPPKRYKVLLSSLTFVNLSGQISI